MVLTRSQAARQCAPLTPAVASPSQAPLNPSTSRPLASPLTRARTLVEVTLSDTGLGTHVRWKRPYEEGNSARVTPGDPMDASPEDVEDEGAMEATTSDQSTVASRLARYTTPANPIPLQIPAAPSKPKPRRVSKGMQGAAPPPPKWNLGVGNARNEDAGGMDMIMEEGPGSDLRSPIQLTSPVRNPYFPLVMKKALGPCGTELLDENGRQLYYAEEKMLDESMEL